MRTCRKYLDAIRDFPTPTNITDVRSWFGLINQVSYAFAANERILPFCQLLKPGAPFVWDNDLNNLFEESKSMIIDEIEEGVRIFDKSKLTCLAIDWSKTGIGYWLFQKHCRCPTNTPFCCRTGWKTTLVVSHFTHAAESRYYTIEGEALAIADALDKARFFVLGCSDRTVAVDHKPLLKVLVIDPSRTFQTLDSVTSRRRPCVIDSEWYTSLAFGTKQLMPYPATPLARKPQKC